MGTTITLDEIREYLNEFISTPDGHNAMISKGFQRFCMNFGDFICNKKNTVKFPQMVNCTSADINKLVEETLNSSNGRKL